MSERYTPGYTANAANFMAQRSAASHAAFFMPHLQPGMQLLDCGCGPGAITVGLADRVAPGKTIGIDAGVSQIEQATAYATQQHVENVTFRAANVYALPFADHTFDALFSHALLEHLAKPVEALREMRRVLKGDAVAGLCSPDWGGFIVAPSTPMLEKAIAFYQALQRANGGDVLVGRKLGTLLQAAGFVDVQLHARYECYTDLCLIGEYLAQRIEQTTPAEWQLNGQPLNKAQVAAMAQALRDWQVRADGLFAQAWVSVIGRVPRAIPHYF